MGPGYNPSKWYLKGFLNWGTPKSSKSLDHDLVLKPMVLGIPCFKKPQVRAFRGDKYLWFIMIHPSQLRRTMLMFLEINYSNFLWQVRGKNDGYSMFLIIVAIKILISRYAHFQTDPFFSNQVRSQHRNSGGKTGWIFVRYKVTNFPPKCCWLQDVGHKITTEGLGLR